MKVFITIWLMMLGAIMGSFLACMGYRIPNKIKTTFPSSFCPHCKKTLKWYMNIPIFSYIFLKGRCAYCKKKIGFIYFFCELLLMILYGLNYYLFGFSINFFLNTILASLLIVTIVSDFKYYYISDRMIIISFILILIVKFLFLPYKEVLFDILSSVILFLVMYGIKIMGNYAFKRESLGDGDIKLMVVLALALGLINSFVALFFASIIALIFSIITIKSNKEGIVPFGPFLIIGSMIVIYFVNYIDPFIKSLF